MKPAGKKAVCFVILTCFLALTGGISAFGPFGPGSGSSAGPASVRLPASGLIRLFGPAEAQAAVRPDDMDEEVWSRLQDNVMEFDELADLVEYYSPTYQQILQSVMPMIELSQETASQMNKELQELKKQVREYKKTLQDEHPELMTYLDSMISSGLDQGLSGGFGQGSAGGFGQGTSGSLGQGSSESLGQGTSGSSGQGGFGQGSGGFGQGGSGGMVPDISQLLPPEALQYVTLSAMVKVYEPMIKQIRSAGSTMNRETLSLRNQMKKTLTSAAQQIFIGYHQALASKDLCDQAVALAQAAAVSAETRQSIGMATENDVLTARQSLLAAQGQQMTVENMIVSLRQQLCLMTGWNYDDEPEIGPVPLPDLSRIETMDPDTDITAAINASYTIDELRDSLSGRGTNAARRARTISEAEENLKIQLQSLYQTVLTDQASLEAADTALEAADITMAAGERQYELGLIGRLQYLQLELMHLQQQMAVDSASLNLTQAILNYDWAMQGIVLTGQAAMQ